MNIIHIPLFNITIFESFARKTIIQFSDHGSGIRYYSEQDIKMFDNE